jgi:hypothetical protein
MKIDKKYLKVAATFSAIIFLCNAADAQGVNQSAVADDSASLRKILISQPNYTAVQTSMILNPDEGFGGKSKVAKLGSRSREETDDAIFVREPGKPTIKIYPKRKEYSEVSDDKPPDFPLSAEDLVKRDDVTFKLAGAEKLGEYNCLKIQASYKMEKVEMKYSFYVSPELKNLIVREEISLGLISSITFLENVSFNVSEELFNLPAGYKKITEPVLDDPAKDILRELNNPVRRHTKSNSKGRRHS